MSRSEHPPCRVVLVRHASAAGQGRFLGQRDAPLSALGRRQVPALVEKLRAYPVEAIYCSDLSRTRTTAAAVARRRRISPEVRPQLREMDFGRWEGLSWDEVVERFPALAKRWVSGRSIVSVPGGEPMVRFKTRVTRELKRIVAAGPGRCVVVVTHAGVIRIALGAALGLDDRHLFRIAQPPCAVSVIDYFRGGAIVRCING
ncbi:MAG TPA: histidine phosphatase family protein [Vicinamibacterales bacterium]|nr:histidine phosphatase family protein [Vicinamibacterales bacterium]